MNRRPRIPAQVHRFRDCVGLYVGTGETVYLTPPQARQLTRAINRVARSCENEAFGDSSGLTAAFDFPAADHR